MDKEIKVDIAALCHKYLYFCLIFRYACMFTFRLLYNLLWSPYGIGQTIIFSSCGFFMAALCHRTGHYIFAMWFLSIFYLSFFSSPNLSSRRLDVYHTLTHGVALCANLECRSEMCCTRLAANAGPKKSPKLHHPTTLSDYIFATKACIDNRKKIVKQQYLLYMSRQYGELRPTSG